MKNKIKDFLLSPEIIKNRPIAEINDETKLFEVGLLESFNVINLVLFIEDAYKIQLGSSDLLGQNFATISDIEKLIIKKIDEKKNA